MNFSGFILDFADQLETVGNLLMIFAAHRWADGYRLVTVRLSVGTFRIRKKDRNDLPTLTAIVSETFFAGAWLPADVRAELIALTTPKAKDVVYFEKKGGHVDPPINK